MKTQEGNYEALAALYDAVQANLASLEQENKELKEQVDLWKSRAKKLAKLVPDNIMTAFAFVVDTEVDEIKALKVEQDKLAEQAQEIERLKEDVEKRNKFIDKLGDQDATKDRELSELREQVKGSIQVIPQWIIDYDKAGHQSSAGKAIRALLEINKNTHLLLNDTTRRSVENGVRERENVRVLREALEFLYNALKAIDGFKNWRQEGQPEFEQMLIVVDEAFAKYHALSTLSNEDNKQD